jgi:hypothetical protein
MSIFITRCATCLILLVAVPTALLGQTNLGQTNLGQTPLGQAPEAILHAQGGVWVNGSEARDSSAVFSGDEIETKAGFSATLNIEGSTVLIQSESVGKLEDNLFALDHGSVSVTTSKNFKVRVKCLTVVPVSEAWTQYDVTDVNGNIQVAARKSDVNVEHEGSHKSATANSDSQNGSVHEGNQRNYSEADLCGVEKRKTPGSLTPEWIAGAAAGTGLLIWLLVHGGPPAQPMSNATP